MPPATRPARLVSLDAYRGFIMLLMASAGLNLGLLADRSKEKPVPADPSTLIERAQAADRWLHDQVPQPAWDDTPR